MRIVNLSPLETPWDDGSVHFASSWRSVDSLNAWHERVRTVYHYGTAMVEFVSNEFGPWRFEPVSVGWGSVTDQKYCNQLAQAVGAGLRFCRDTKGGGPRWVTIENGNR